MQAKAMLDIFSGILDNHKILNLWEVEDQQFLHHETPIWKALESTAARFTANGNAMHLHPLHHSDQIDITALETNYWQVGKSMEIPQQKWQLLECKVWEVLDMLALLR